ncbi:hypothetical protein BCR33DRAFT_713628 [Rhizoclosmatium globosum]|uniref:CST complex subunit CTC1 n=1 Tax=Rhizoclosmatium globosum TaxID=329046 RepID=A0A1Y2CSS0_9FUNG|nr:hypothetical protein BCR33DRAFT_713628 [Rhizoclosmatium globosum]|eukprot:ORY50051.1 hypothetical protein BCR33DRAFT_713628 [Rhizoclosmatium globosum]
MTAHLLFEQKTSTALPFSNRITKIFEDLLVNRVYIFQDLEPKQIKFTSKLPDPSDPKSNIMRLLAFIPNESKLYPLDESAASQFMQLIKNKIISYTGTITKILELEIGKYQLDNKHDLYLSYHPLPLQTEQLLIPGTKITLHNVHTILYTPINLPHSLPNRAVFVACFNTTVEITHLPPIPTESQRPTTSIETQPSYSIELAPITPSLHRSRAAIKQKWQGLNISDLLLLDDIYSTLLSYDPSTSHDFASSCFQLSKRFYRGVKAGDPRLSAVLAHDTECTVAELRYLQPFLVSLDMILGQEDNNDSEPGIVQEYIINLSNEDVSEKPGGREYAFRVFSQEELGMDGCFLMGKIEWEDGGLKFTDSSGSSPVLIVLLDSPNETEWKISAEILGTCVIILDFEVVVEVLGVCYTGEQGSAQPLLKVYLRCFKKDLLFRQWFLESMDVNCGEAVTQIAEGRMNAIRLKLYSSRLKKRLACLELLVVLLPKTGQFKSTKLLRTAHAYWPVLQRGGRQIHIFEDQDGGRNASLYCQLTSESEITTVNIQSAPAVEQNGTFDFGHQNPILYLDFSPLPDPQTVQSLLRTIVSKSFTAKATWDMHERLPAHTLFQVHNIGLGRYDRVLVLKLTDPRHANGFHNPADSTLQYTLTRTLYGESVCDTWIEILAPSGPQNTVDSTVKMSIAQHFADTMHTLPRIHLLNVYSIPPTLKTSPFTILFTVNHIEQVLLWCECSGCGVKLTSSEIKCTCRRSDSPSLKVQASAKLFIDDGSCEAMLLLESFESVVGLFPATQRKLEDAVLGCRVLREESWVKADTVIESYDNDDVGGIETAKRILFDAIASVSLATDYIACCRQVSSHGRLDDDEEYDLENINLTDLYSRIGMKDLTRRQLKVAEGAMITVWSPPRIVLHGYYVEKANPLVEGMRF